MRRIVIASSPRCGTGLLVNSLATHPAAVNAGEVLNEFDTATDEDWLESQDRTKMIQRHTLFKLLSIYHEHQDFDQFRGWGFVVYLYRRDREAQKNSWRRAAESGIWSTEQSEPIPPVSVADADMDALIGLADHLFLRAADLVLSYEHLANNWTECNARIQSGAGWTPRHLPMVCRPNVPTRKPGTGTAHSSARPGFLK